MCDGDTVVVDGEKDVLLLLLLILPLTLLSFTLLLLPLLKLLNVDLNDTGRLDRGWYISIGRLRFDCISTANSSLTRISFNASRRLMEEEVGVLEVPGGESMSRVNDLRDAANV